MKKVVVIFVIFMIIIAIFGVVNYTYGADYVEDIMQDGNNFLSKGGTSLVGSDKLGPFSQDMFGTVFSIGVAVAVIVGIVLGVQYIFSSVEQKAKSKQNLIAYVIGCGVLFGAFGIWRIIVKIFNNL